MPEFLTKMLYIGGALAIVYGCFAIWRWRFEKERAQRIIEDSWFIHRYPRTITLGTLFAVIFFVSLGAAAVIQSGYDRNSGTLAMMSLFVLGYVAALIYMLRRHYRSSEHGVELVEGSHRTFVAWEEISKVQFHWLSGLIIRTKSRHEIKVSAAATSFQEFATLVIEKVPKNNIDSKIYKIIEDAADGRLPNIFSGVGASAAAGAATATTMNH